MSNSAEINELFLYDSLKISPVSTCLLGLKLLFLQAKFSLVLPVVAAVIVFNFTDLLAAILRVSLYDKLKALCILCLLLARITAGVAL